MSTLTRSTFTTWTTTRQHHKHDGDGMTIRKRLPAAAVVAHVRPGMVVALPDSSELGRVVSVHYSGCVVEQEDGRRLSLPWSMVAVKCCQPDPAWLTADPADDDPRKSAMGSVSAMLAQAH